MQLLYHSHTTFASSQDRPQATKLSTAIVLATYGLGWDVLKLIKNYLSKRKQRVKINSLYSNWRDITIGALQGSVLGPLLFNIIINDILFIVNNANICSYADDTTIYTGSSDLNTIINTLEIDRAAFAKWFSI